VKNNPTNYLLAELAEDQAKGELAGIYDEIRHFSAVPYVSSLQRYLATMPGVLEWAWAAIRPAMVSGTIPETGWRLARSVRITPLPPVSMSALRLWGVDVDGLAAIRNIAENFVRVSPVNLMTGACLRMLLTGATSEGAGFAENWSPPPMLAPMPGNVDPTSVPADSQAVLRQVATEVDGKPFVPALYRQLAHWPSFLAWFAGPPLVLLPPLDLSPRQWVSLIPVLTARNCMVTLGGALLGKSCRPRGRHGGPLMTTRPDVN
jgi:hypothetical protein